MTQIARWVEAPHCLTFVRQIKLLHTHTHLLHVPLLHGSSRCQSSLQQ